MHPLPWSDTNQNLAHLEYTMHGILVLVTGLHAILGARGLSLMRSYEVKKKKKKTLTMDVLWSSKLHRNL